MQSGAAHNRTWAEVDLKRVRHNYRVAAGFSGGAEVMPVIKADAYGHGAEAVAAALMREGAARFAVAAPDEALSLRGSGIDAPILLLGAAPEGRVAELCRAKVALCAPSLETAKMYDAAGAGHNVTIHIKLDTGMSRLGLSVRDAVESAIAIANLPHIKAEGIFTHFAAADEPGDDDFTKKQFAGFMRVAGELEGRGMKLTRHCANSAAVMYHPYARADLTRPGIMLYGYDPAGGSRHDLEPALSWRASVIQVREIETGRGVGYGRAWRSPGSRRIATVAVGYADGLRRNLSGSGWHVLIRGYMAPIVGRVCMDMCMIDVTDVPGASEGDAVTIIGEDGGERVTADDMAKHLGTISYEILCGIGRRVPRYFTDAHKD
jgi:alanine racemase